MNFANKLGEHFQHLQALGAKYADYQRININQMDLREPVNEYEKKIASKAKSENNLFSIIIIIAFAATLFFTIRSDAGLGLIILVSIISVLCIVLSIASLTKTAQVRTAIAIYKDYEYQSDSTSKHYYITIIPDDGQKYMCLGVSVSEKDYEAITEGTPVLVVRVGLDAKAFLLN